MSFASSRVRMRFSYVIAFVTFLAAVFSYGFSAWSASRRYDAVLPRDASDSVISGLLAFHQATGGFPAKFTEVEKQIWKHKRPPNFGEGGRTLSVYNYNYVFFQVTPHECAFFVIPGGARREEAPSYYYYVTTDWIWKWKGPALRDADISKLKPVRPGSSDAMLLGVLGMTEQPKAEIRMRDTNKKASLVNFKQE